MVGFARGVLVAFMVSAMAGTALSQPGEALDTTRLPRTPDAKIVYSNPAQTIFTTGGTVAETAQATRALLAAGGWQLYGTPFAQEAQNPDLAILNFKRGREGLSVFIRVAPAQNNATGVTYAPIAYANDLPFTKDATGILFDPNRPHLNLVTAGSLDATLAFFRTELAARGWTPWSREINGPQPSGADVKHDRGASAYYTRDGQRPLLLTLQPSEDNRIKVELKGVPQSLLAPPRPRDQSAAANAPAPPAPPARTAVDDAAEAMMKEAMDAVRAATADALRPPAQQRQAQRQQPQPSQPMPPAPAPQALKAMADNPAPIPVPDTAETVAYDSVAGSVEYSSTSGVASVAGFYRAEMKSQGWQERPSVINRDNMVVLNYTKAGKNLTITVMRMGQKVNVDARGPALITATARPPERTTVAPPPSAGPPAVLEAEEMGGLPVPTQTTQKGTERTPFRTELNAQVPADLASVLAFYRSELAKRNWKEDAPAASVKADQASLVYTSPDGPATLSLGRRNGETTVLLSLRKPEAAAKAGLLPKAGQAKLVIGNTLQAEATVTVNNRTIKVAAGVGSRAPDGPSLDLAPGKYKYSLRIPGKPAFQDEIEVGADQAWGLLIGPGGGLALQAY